MVFIKLGVWILFNVIFIGIMIEELLIVLYLKCRLNLKVEVEEDLDVFYLLKYIILMCFYMFLLNFKLYVFVMKVVFFIELRCVCIFCDLFVYLLKVVVLSCYFLIFVYFCLIFYLWFIMEDVDLF